MGHPSRYPAKGFPGQGNPTGKGLGGSLGLGWWALRRRDSVSQAEGSGQRRTKLCPGLSVALVPGGVTGMGRNGQCGSHLARPGEGEVAWRRRGRRPEWLSQNHLEGTPALSMDGGVEGSGELEPTSAVYAAPG